MAGAVLECDGSAGVVGEAFAAEIIDSSESESTGAQLTMVGSCFATGTGTSVGLDARGTGSPAKSP